MNVIPESSPVPDAEGPVTEDVDTSPKPVRKRRAVKPAGGAGDAASVDAGNVVASGETREIEAATAGAGTAGADETEGSVPKTRRRRAAVVAPVAAELFAPASDAPVAAEAPVHAAPAAATEVEAASVVAAEVGFAPTDGSPVPSAPADAPTGDALAPVDAKPPAPETEASEVRAGEEPTSEPRDPGRRRNRRERQRGDRPDAGAAPASGDMAAEPGSGSKVDSGVDTDADPGRETRAEARADAPARLPAVEAGDLFAQVLSGGFDAAGEVAEGVTDPVAPKRVLLAEPDAPKLHKVLAQSGIGSRRDMEDLIADGRVTVNGDVAHVGQRISFGDRVAVNGKPVRLRIVPPPPRIIAYHKPVGEIVTHDDPQNRPTVFRRLPRLQQGKWQSVGRLDINTEGLLLFTNSGELANQLMHPRFGVEREYAVRVLGVLTEDDKRALLAGVEVEGQTAGFKSIDEGGGDGANHWYRVVITEGRNREVRKLFDAVGLTVSRLIRIRYGTVVLPLGLKRGVWVDLEDGDVRSIRCLAGAPNGPRDPAAGAGPRIGTNSSPPRNERQNGRPNEAMRPNGNPRNRPHEAPAMSPSADARNAGMERDFDRDDDDADLDFDPSSIPNPLEQTFDKRFVQNPRSPAGGRGFGRGGGGFGAGGSAPLPVKPQKGPGPKQPDPLQTSLGFIGADAFHRKNRGGGGGNGGNGGGSRGGGYGGNGGGGNNGGFGGGRRGR